MKTYIWLFLLFSMLPSVSFSDVEVVFSSNKINQGSLEKVSLKIDPETAQSLQLQGLKSRTIGETLYFYSVSPLLRKDGETAFEAEATVIFTKVPKGSSVIYKSPAGEVKFTWNLIEVVPTEAPKELLFGYFDAPARNRIFLWSLIFLGFLLSAGIGYKVWSVWNRKNLIKKRRSELKDNIFSANDYDSVVVLWQNKRIYFAEFPHIENPFKEFEKILFRYQFKQQQSAQEINEVMSAWRKFLDEIKGGFNGI